MAIQLRSCGYAHADLAAGCSIQAIAGAAHADSRAFAGLARGDTDALRPAHADGDDTRQLCRQRGHAQGI